MPLMCVAPIFVSFHCPMLPHAPTKHNNTHHLSHPTPANPSGLLPKTKLHTSTLYPSSITNPNGQTTPFQTTPIQKSPLQSSIKNSINNPLFQIQNQSLLIPVVRKTTSRHKFESKSKPQFKTSHPEI